MTTSNWPISGNSAPLLLDGALHQGIVGTGSGASLGQQRGLGLQTHDLPSQNVGHDGGEVARPATEVQHDVRAQWEIPNSDARGGARDGGPPWRLLASERAGVHAGRRAH